MHTCTHTYTHTYLHTHIHTHTHTIQDRLQLSVLRENVKLKPHIKCKGRPKHSSKLWPSKNTKAKRSRKENLPPCEDGREDSHEAPKVKRRRVAVQPGTAANRIRMRREKAVGSHDDTTECSGGTISSGEEGVSEGYVCLQISGEKLLQSDLDILKSSSGWLNERLINAGQTLIKEKFPNESGLQDVGRSDTCTFQVHDGEFVQLLNCHRSHWICVTNKNSKSNEVKVYDSMRTGDIPLSTKEVIASLLNLRQTYIYLTFPDVQQQVGGSECGLYSLAFAYTLCSGKDPACLEYNQAQFRSHFLHCLKSKDVDPFPHSVVMKNPGKSLFRKFKVYCLCRLPHTGDSMVQCSECLEWYHFNCVGLEEDAVLPEEWRCITCKDT